MMRIRKHAAGFLCLLLVVTLLLGLWTVPAGAAQRQQKSRAIAIVFDNSGSMYSRGNQAWCRATYAIEVFAAMMNDSDTLQVYPMWPVEVDGRTYDDADPVTVRGGGDISAIRKMYTPAPSGTPIETVDAAYSGVRRVNADEHWIIVLTDGEIFYENDEALDPGGYDQTNTEAALSERLTRYGADVNIMYMGIGQNAVMPNVTPGRGKQYYADKAVSSTEVLSKLTTMCNTIFGRDAMEASGGEIDFDVSLGKLFLFVQGSGVSDVALKDASGSAIAPAGDAYAPRYSEEGCGGDYAGQFGVDQSLSGVIATYQTLDAGSYTLSYSGNVSSVGVYYEPDVDAQVLLVDQNGQVCDPNRQDLEAGVYTLRYGLVDRDGNFTDSALLGTKNYELTYVLNGETHTVSSDRTAEERITLEINDTFKPSIDVSYLNGYTIHKDARELGWPELGLTIPEPPEPPPPPLPEYELQAVWTVPKDEYMVSKFADEAVYSVAVSYQGTPITGADLDKIHMHVEVTGDGELDWKMEQTHDGFVFRLGHKGALTDTVCGSYQISSYFTADTFEDKIFNQSNTLDIPFTIVDDSHSLGLKVEVPQDYILRSKLSEAEPIRIRVEYDGQPATAEVLRQIDLQVELDAPHEMQMLPDGSGYELRLKDTDELKMGRYKISASASATDEVGRTAQASDSGHVEIQKHPRWIRWAIAGLILLVLLLLLLFFMNQKVLPKKIGLSKTIFTVDGSPVTGTAACKFSGGKKKRGALEIGSPRYSTNPLVKCGFRLELEAVSPRKTKSAARMARVKSVTPSNVNAVDYIKIGSVAFMKDPTTHKLVRAGAAGKGPVEFDIGTGARCTVTGEVMDGEGGSTAISLVVVLKYY